MARAVEMLYGEKNRLPSSAQVGVQVQGEGVLPLQHGRVGLALRAGLQAGQAETNTDAPTAPVRKSITSSFMVKLLGGGPCFVHR